MTRGRISGWAINGTGPRARVKKGTARFSSHEWWFHDEDGDYFAGYPSEWGEGDETALSWLYASKKAALEALMERITAEIAWLEGRREEVLMEHLKEVAAPMLPGLEVKE